MQIMSRRINLPRIWIRMQIARYNRKIETRIMLHIQANMKEKAIHQKHYANNWF